MSLMTIGAVVALVVPLYVALYRIGKSLGKLEADVQGRSGNISGIQRQLGAIEYALQTNDGIDFAESVGADYFNDGANGTAD